MSDATDSQNSTVYVFNAADTAINFVINNGSQVQIAASAGPGSWTPGTAPTGTPIQMNYGLPAAGILGYGPNNCTLTPATSGGEAPVTITVPKSILPPSQVQLYLFYADADHVTWVLLDQGLPVSGSLSLPSS